MKSGEFTCDEDIQKEKLYNQPSEPSDELAKTTLKEEPADFGARLHRPFGTVQR